MKRILTMLLSLLFLFSLLPLETFAEETGISVTLTQNTGAVIEIAGASNVACEQPTLAAVRLEGNKIIVTGEPDAVGIARIHFTVAEQENTVEIPIGYTTFHFDSDKLEIFEGRDTAYEVTGIDNTAGLQYEKETLPVYRGAEGGLLFKNEGSYHLNVQIKKSGGTYVFWGTGNDMSVSVAKDATGNAVLLLGGLTLQSSYTAVVTVKKKEVPSSQTVTLTALEGSVNTLTDSAYNADETNTEYGEGAVIKGKTGANVILNGTGALQLNCNSKNAVKVGEYGSLLVEGLNLTVDSKQNGLSSENTLEIRSGKLDITARDGDGIRTDPEAVTESCAGNILISGGTIKISAASDGIQAMQDIVITDGSLDITTGGGYNDRSFNANTMSCKGIKASGNEEEDTADATNKITISGGSFTLNTADDAIHSDAYVEITGGTFQIKTGDDGVHADTTLKLGTEGSTYNKTPKLTITDCYEGLEAGTVNLYSGTYTVTSSDDGVNAAGGNDGSGGFGPGGGGFNPGGGWRPGGGGGNMPGGGGSSDYSINIYGGKLTVNADGDGLDSNGALNLLGGTCIVWGQSSGGNAALDSDGSLVINGATVFAAGYSNMAQNPSGDSQKYLTYRQSVTKGKTINVKYNDTTVYNTLCIKPINYVIYSSPEMVSTNGWSITVDNSEVLPDSDEEYDCTKSGHVWDAGTITLASACTRKGTKEYTCTVCNSVKTEEIETVSHQYENGYCVWCEQEDSSASWPVVSFAVEAGATVRTFQTQDITAAYGEGAAYARDSETGRKDLMGEGQVNFTVVCEPGYEVDTVTASPAENYKNLKLPEETGAGYRITKITGDVIVSVTVKASACAHDYEAVVTQPTCTKGGYTTHTCTKCGDSYRAEETDSSGHLFQDGKCTRCGEADPDYEKPCPSEKYTDVLINWAHEGIDYCIANNFMNGVSETVFAPNGVVTRAQLVTVLYRIAGAPETVESNAFTDVPSGAWYANAVSWAVSKGIVNGTAPGKFNPMGYITREQIAAILYRYMGSPAVTGSLLAFADGNTVGSYAENALLWATEAGLINGISSKGETRLAPKSYATRGQIASIIMRFCGGAYACRKSTNHN